MTDDEIRATVQALTEGYVTDAMDRAFERYEAFVIGRVDYATPLGILLLEELTGRESDYTTTMRSIDTSMKRRALA